MWNADELSARSTFDKAVCSEPLAFAADAGLWVLNGGYARQRSAYAQLAAERRCGRVSDTRELAPAF